VHANQALYTARKLGRDYRGIRDRDSISRQPVAVTVIGGREMKLYKLEQFGMKEEKR
jgi:hypothetical protein